MLPTPIRLAGAAALLSLSALAAPPAAEPAAASTLSLRDAIVRAERDSPELAQFAFRLRAQSARIDAAALRPATEVHAQVENVLGSDRTRKADAAETTFALSQLIELGGQRTHRVDAARGTFAELMLERQLAQLEVLAELSRRYIHVASDQKQLELTGLATELAEKTAREVERRVQAARSPAVELHRARIALTRARVAQEHAEHELLSSRRKLAAMWGAREADFGAVSGELFTLPAVGDYESLLQQLQNSPERLRFATEARQRDAEIRLAEARTRAAITVSAGVRHLREGEDTALVAGVSLPLFSGARAQPALAEARAQREHVDARSTAAKVRAEASLFELVQELRHSITEAEMLRDEVLPQMDAVLAATEHAWQRGRYGYLEWTDAQRERIDVQRALIQAAANAHLFQAEIERLTGAATTAIPVAGVSP